MSELLPCPFCGGEAHVKKDYVECTTCGAFIVQTSFGKGDGIHQVINRWNHRHYPPEVQQAIERMKPKKVINKWSQHGMEYGDCPACICPVERKPWDDHQHCDRCGQALDWSEDE